ncbi:MAG TPA: universal stress protein [Microvirga sp.]|jgi:nucleotide-binding universal stress UspA family protein|nr:universal stress protein [Microvirga sp.]
MRNILVPLEEHSLLPQVLETALLLGRTFESYIEGLAITLDLPVAMPVDMAIGAPSILDPTTRREMAAACYHHFETYMTGQSIPRAGAGERGLSFGRHEGDLANDAFLGTYARLFDLTVVGRPSNRTNHARLATVEAALFESGRPVLVVPPSVPSAIGRRVVIAWNRSTETARTVAFGMPLLARAESVVVLEAEGWGSGAATGESLAASLRRNGIPAEFKMARGTGGPGAVVLATAASLGCDLLLKGAYTQSRIRQMIFGGATNHILSSTELPVLMAH